jgi:hypothetical protein
VRHDTSNLEQIKVFRREQKFTTSFANPVGRIEPPNPDEMMIFKGNRTPARRRCIITSP